MPSSHLILCRPLLLLPPIPPSIRVFSNESTFRMRWPKYWSYCFSISLSKEHPGLISFRIDWLDLLAVQGSSKSLLQHHSSKASILWHSAFFTVQLSHPYMTTGKTIALTRWTFVGKVTSLILNILSRLVITFLPRSKHLLISWLQSPSEVILEFCSKEFMIWATVSFRSCFCWLYRASLSLAIKNILSDFDVDHLVMSMYRVVSSVVGRGCLLWPVCSLCKTLLVVALLHFVFQGQICLLLLVSLDFLFLHSSPLWGKGHIYIFFWC